MDGLTNIISKINSDAQNEYEQIIQAAKDKANELLADAKNAAREEIEKMQNSAQKKAELVKSKAASGSELEYKRILLSEKCKIIDEVLKMSVEYISSLDDVKYFELIDKLVISNALSSNGVIFFNQRDNQRLPEGFIDTLNEKLGQNKQLRLSDKTILCNAGFVIEYDEMRVDCTVESLIFDMSDEIKDELSSILF